MNRQTLRVLVVLNLVMLIAVVVVGLMPQPAQAQLARSEYIMVSGEVTGRSQQNAIYIINLGTNQIAAVLFNSGTNNLEPVGGRTLE